MSGMRSVSLGGWCSFKTSRARPLQALLTFYREQRLFAHSLEGSVAPIRGPLRESRSPAEEAPMSLKTPVESS